MPMPTPTIPLTDIPEEEEPAENPFCPDFISYDKMLDIVESLPEGYCKVFKLAVLEGVPQRNRRFTGYSATLLFLPIVPGENFT